MRRLVSNWARVEARKLWIAVADMVEVEGVVICGIRVCSRWDKGLNFGLDLEFQDWTFWTYAGPRESLSIEMRLLH